MSATTWAVTVEAMAATTPHALAVTHRCSADSYEAAVAASVDAALEAWGTWVDTDTLTVRTGARTLDGRNDRRVVMAADGSGWVLA